MFSIEHGTSSEGKNRRSALKLLGISVAAVAAPATMGGVTPAIAAEKTAEDRHLDRILASLDALPEKLKSQTAADNPNYEDELRQHLGSLTVLSQPKQPPQGMARAAFDPVQCPAEVAKFAATVAFPVFKIIGWIRKARKIWGSVANIRYAIRSGQAAGEIGPEAAVVLEELLGLGGVRQKCFG